MSPLATRLASVGFRNRVGGDGDLRMVRHGGWFSGEFDSGAGLGQGCVGCVALDPPCRYRHTASTHSMRRWRTRVAPRAKDSWRAAFFHFPPRCGALWGRKSSRCRIEPREPLWMRVRRVQIGVFGQLRSRRATHGDPVERDQNRKHGWTGTVCLSSASYHLCHLPARAKGGQKGFPVYAG